MTEGDQRIADAAGVVARASELEVLAAREDVGAEVVAGVIRAVVPALNGDTGSYRVHAAHVVQVRRQLEVLLCAAALHLRAAAGKSIEHADRRRFELRPRRRTVQTQLHARIQERVTANRS